MDLSFLGTSCAVPTADNGYTSFLVAKGDILILIDASGNPVQSILRTGKNPVDLDILVLTHYHADHISGYPALIQTLGCMGRKKPLKVLADSCSTDKAKRLLDLLELYPERMGYRIEYLKGFSSTDLEIELIDGNHTIPSSMVLFTEDSYSVLYTSDTAYSRKAEQIARDCRFLIHEATWPQSRLGEFVGDGHSSAYQAALAAASADVEKLFLCHICLHEYRDSDALLQEAKSAFHGEIIVPELFSWYLD